ncbi:hypothetical protein HY346_02805 [Candidatus Microgenomates bacterium]|nr:hypothetical protein [Candidatus Microgenomates bacterium]
MRTDSINPSDDLALREALSHDQELLDDPRVPPEIRVAIEREIADFTRRIGSVAVHHTDALDIAER